MDSTVDTRPFARGPGSRDALTLRASSAFEAFVAEQVRHPNPARVPLAALRAMDSHPIVYLAERTVTGVVRRPDLYYVSHPDPTVVKETEEWLWPLLPSVLGSVARAYAFGCVPVVFNWTSEDLAHEDQRWPNHVHYVSAHELWLDDVEVEREDDRLVALLHGGRRYLADRTQVFVWDASFGSWRGQPARRRAWGDYCRSLTTELLHLRYLERSVDSPRIGYAPGGFVSLAGSDVDAIDHMNKLLVALQGSGAVTFPAERDDKGNRVYEVSPLNLPDRQAVWDRSLNRFDAGILRAYLVPPRLSGLEEIAAAGARTLDGMLKEFIQDLAQFGANELTELVAKVHRKNHREDHVPPPEIKAYEVPASVRKLYLEILRLVSAAKREDAPADWVDVPALLDQLGVPLRSEPLRSPSHSPPGRPRDLVGDREERREQAATESGEDSVGRRSNNELRRCGPPRPLAAPGS